MKHGKTHNKSPRRINHKATRSKTNTGTTALERSAEQTTGGLLSPGVSLTLYCFVIYSTRRDLVLCLTLCHFILVFFSPFSIAITSLGEERANLSAFRTFVQFELVWICRLPLPVGVWEGLRFVIVALPGLFLLPFFYCCVTSPTTLCFLFTKIRLFKYIENFTTKKWKFSDKNSDIFIFLLKTDCGYSLDPPRRGGSNEYPQFVFSRNKKKICTIVNPSFTV